MLLVEAEHSHLAQDKDLKRSHGPELAKDGDGEDGGNRASSLVQQLGRAEVTERKLQTDQSTFSVKNSSTGLTHWHAHWVIAAGRHHSVSEKIADLGGLPLYLFDKIVSPGQGYRKPS